MDTHGSVTIRMGLRPGDLGTIIHLHGLLYARERGWDIAFEAYVAGPLSEFALGATTKERIWIAERDAQMIGCVAIVAASPDVAQLRWLLVDPSARGSGLGKTLLQGAISFAKERGSTEVIL
jgi:GNAT superfamily N-acetyltransferase